MGAATSADRQALTRRRNAEADAVMLALCTGVLLLSALIDPDPSQLRLFGWELPPMCLWKGMLGVDCLGCGLTRSFTYMGHGQLAQAFAMHKAGPLLWALVLAQVPWRLRLLWAWRRGGA